MKGKILFFFIISIYVTILTISINNPNVPAENENDSQTHLLKGSFKKQKYGN